MHFEGMEDGILVREWEERLVCHSWLVVPRARQQDPGDQQHIQASGVLSLMALIMFTLSSYTCLMLSPCKLGVVVTGQCNRILAISSVHRLLESYTPWLSIINMFTLSLEFVSFKGGSIGSRLVTDPDLTTVSWSAKNSLKFDFPRGGQLGLGQSPTHPQQITGAISLAKSDLVWHLWVALGCLCPCRNF